ncbi:hypothetical protein ACWDFR_28080 [Streptomyces sp. 900105755]
MPGLLVEQVGGGPPTDVHTTLVIQERTVTSGTLFPRDRRPEDAAASADEAAVVSDVSCAMRPVPRTT